jgi:hypothetical protein
MASVKMQGLPQLALHPLSEHDVLPKGALLVAANDIKELDHPSKGLVDNLCPRGLP